jgi:hypothetical protein
MRAANTKFARVLSLSGDPSDPEPVCASEEGATSDDNYATWLGYGDALPDLSDPATLGCLLALVREAWASRGFVSVRHPVVASLGEPWDVVVYNAGGDLVARFGGATEAEALVNALENAP